METIAMWQIDGMELTGEELLLAGQRVEPGLYKEIGTGKTVLIDQEDLLPATLDGRIGCYVRISNLWSQKQSRSLSDRSADRVSVAA